MRIARLPIELLIRNTAWSYWQWSIQGYDSSSQ